MGIFELVLKIGFGVAFDFLVYDTLDPMAGIAGSEFDTLYTRLSMVEFVSSIIHLSFY